MTTTQFFRLSCAMLTLTLSAGALQADPIPGRDLTKFSQQPMINTTITDTTGTVLGTFGGHDEWSTAYGIGNAAFPPQDYSGRFMADDFADNFNTPVVHVKWWGSYRNDNINPNMPVNKFLISFEDDVPAGPAPSFSRPTDVNNFNQVVTRGPISPGSGTFTETLIRGPDLVVNESLYEYNAELHLGKEFLEKADTIYWLKIVAMVDIPQAFPQPFNNNNPPPQATLWGWHNRDYTVQNPLASPNVAPGETQVGSVGSAPIWHFQDDAVEGDVRILPGSMGFQMPLVFQPATSMSPTKYLDNADGPGQIPGTTFPGISAFSKDLAFEIYTTQIVPEPATCVLAVFGLAAVLVRRRVS